MRSPKGRIAPVDPSEVKMFEDEGFSVVSRIPGNAKEVNEAAANKMLSDLRGMAGAALPVAAATGAGMLMGGPAGAGAGLVRGIGASLAEGAAAGLASIPGRAMQGKPTDAKAAVTEGAITAATGGAGRLIGRAVRALPRPAMKGALGSALPGIEDEAIKAGQVMSNEGLAARKLAIEQAGAKAQAAIDASQQQFSPASLKRSIMSLRRGAAKSDLVSNASEAAYTDVLANMNAKLGNRRAMTARDIEDIRKYADDKAAKFHEARVANNEKVVGAEEAAYVKIGNTARKMLATIPEVKAARAEETAAIRLYDAVFDALKRSPRWSLATSLGLAGGYPGAFSGDPLTAMGGMAAGFGVGAFGSHPYGLSRIALGASQPAVQHGAALLPRLIQLGVNESNRGGR